jgi:O-antigen ligase
MLIPFVALLLTTVSQAAQIAFLTGFAAFVLFPAKARILRIAFGILLVSGITASPWIAPVMFDTLADLFLSNRFLIEASASSRLEIWDAVSGKIMEKPVTGYGMYSSRFIDDFDIKKLYYTSGTVMHPHNAALQLWLEFGIPGAVAANAAVLYFLNVCYKSDMRAIRIYFSLFSMLLTVSLLGWGLWQAWWLGAVFASSGFIIIAGRLLMSSRTEHC